MTRSMTLSKFNNVVKQIGDNWDSFDPDQLEKLADELQTNLARCYRIDREILAFLKSKMNFSSIPSLKTFSKNTLGYSCTKRSRKEVELEIASAIASRGLSVDELQPSLAPKKARVSEPKKKTVRKKKVLPDISQTWIRMNRDELRAEFARFSEVADLKAAADSLFKGNDRRLRKRESVESRIIERLAERKALYQLGQ